MSAFARNPAVDCIDHYHPLEVIPYFRRFPQSFGRDFLYTFIWNAFFAIAFYGATTISEGRVLPFGAFKLIFLVSNIIGYTIHGLYEIGNLTGLDAAARRTGGPMRVAYYSAVPVIGVMLGFWFASYVVDKGLRAWLTDPGMLIGMLSISVIVAIVLSVVYFWRERDAQTAREAALANLRTLQAQIEPHFLFNTLANVVSLIDPQPATAKRMLERFISFLRASLNATRTQSTTLGAEAELIGAYLDVLQVRMGARLRYAIEVPAELSSVTIAPMMLQPLVENAIRHGLEPDVDGGEVRFTARRANGAVMIDIADTGVGFAPATRGGIGLGNLRERLKLLYGERASVAIADNQPRGSRVTVTIPA